MHLPAPISYQIVILCNAVLSTSPVLFHSSQLCMDVVVLYLVLRALDTVEDDVACFQASLLLLLVLTSSQLSDCTSEVMTCIALLFALSVCTYTSQLCMGVRVSYLVLRALDIMQDNTTCCQPMTASHDTFEPFVISLPFWNHQWQLCMDVLVFYLVLRALDTVEDDMMCYQPCLLLLLAITIKHNVIISLHNACFH